MKLKFLQVIVMLSKWTAYGFCLQMFFLNLMIAGSATGQKSASVKEVEIKLDARISTVRNLFKEIEDKTVFRFSLDRTELKSALRERIYLPEEKVKVAEVLMEVSKNSKVKFKQINNNINVRKIGRNENADYSLNLVQVVADVNISGKITDENGEGLPGASVVVKGTTQGTTSDISGNYSINVPEDATIVFSFVGYQTKEVSVVGRTVIDLQMTPDAEQLEEVVVVGYGTEKKINLTGAVTDVNISKDLGERPTANITTMLQGVLPGLTVGTNNSGGEPGSTQSLNIRGAGTLTGNGGTPYILVDGIPYGSGELNSLNPNDIENVTVLKDAASSAIYGSKGAYGVILIETKKGQNQDKTKIEYSSSFQYATPTMLPNMANSLDYANAINTAQVNSGQTPWFDDAKIQKIKDYQNGLIKDEAAADPNGRWGFWSNGYANNDFYDIFFGENVPRVKHDLSVRGGNDKTTYFVSGSYFDQQGAFTIGTDHYDRMNLTFNVSTKATDWLTFNGSARYSDEQKDFPSGGFGGYNKDIIYHQLSRSGPTNPLKDPEGNYITPDANRLAYGGREITDINTSFFNISAVIEPIEDWVTTVTYNRRLKTTFTDREEFRAEVVHPNGDISNYGNNPEEIDKRARNDSRDLFNIVSSYNKNINEVHNISVMGGFEQRLDNYSYVRGVRKVLLTREIPTISTAIGDRFSYDAEGHFATRGVFGRIKYNYNGRYLVEFNGRYDGSSYFSDGNKWGFFPSVSAAYVVSEEAFFIPLTNVVNTMKLRVSWGELGNHDPQLANNYTELMTNSTSQWLEGGAQLVYINPPSIISQDLTWETVTSTNFGLDLGLFNNRLNSTLEIYKRVTSDMIGPSDILPKTLGANSPLVNNGELTTKGWELSMNWRDNIGEDFSYSVGFNLFDSKATITKYNNPTGLLNGRYTGYVLGDMWAYTSVGLYATDQDAEDGPDQSRFRARWQAGDMEYADLDNNGVIDNGSNTLEDHGDLSIVGNNRARMNYGINLRASYKGFDISALFQGVGKRDYIFSSSTNLYYGFRGNIWQNSYTQAAMDYWTPENTDAFFPRPYINGEHTKNTQRQTRFMEDASYLRLKNLQIGYSIPAKLLEKTGFISSVRVYGSGENIWTKTSLNENFDPETLGGGWGGGKIYPPSKVWSLGLNVTF